MGEHECAAPRCTRTVPADKLMCVGHWKRLPIEIQRKVRETWRRVRREPEEYRDARQEAIDWHAAHSGPDTRQGGLF